MVNTKLQVTRKHRPGFLSLYQYYKSMQGTKLLLESLHFLSINRSSFVCCT